MTSPSPGVLRASVVVVCFNYGRFVHEAVDSVLAQEGEPAEVVLVDDGSDDGRTLEVLDELESRGRVRVVRQDNAGVCAARNAGFAATTTPRVIFLDADDRLAPGALRLMHDGLDAHPEAGFAYGHHEYFGAMSGQLRFPPYDPLKLLDRHLIGVTALTRREVLEDTGGFDPAFTSYEDWELWVAALAHGWRGLRVDAVTLQYRRHEQGKFLADRQQYRSFRRQLAAKHADLFARRPELASDSDLTAAGRLVYRWYWGLRPFPPALEAAGQRLLWRPERGRHEERDGASAGG